MIRLIPNVVVEDVNKTMAFYEQVLGFKTIMKAPDAGQCVWALLQNGAAKLMLQEKNAFANEFPNASLPTGKGAVNFYLNVTNVNDLYARIKGKAKIITDLRTTPYGSTEFAIEDCNGLLLAFAQLDNDIFAQLD